MISKIQPIPNGPDVSSINDYLNLLSQLNPGACSLTEAAANLLSRIEGQLPQKDFFLLNKNLQRIVSRAMPYRHFLTIDGQWFPLLGRCIENALVEINLILQDKNLTAATDRLLETKRDELLALRAELIAAMKQYLELAAQKQNLFDKFINEINIAISMAGGHLPHKVLLSFLPRVHLENLPSLTVLNSASLTGKEDMDNITQTQPTLSELMAAYIDEFGQPADKTFLDHHHYHLPATRYTWEISCAQTAQNGAQQGLEEKERVGKAPSAVDKIKQAAEAFKQEAEKGNYNQAQAEVLSQTFIQEAFASLSKNEDVTAAIAYTKLAMVVANRKQLLCNRYLISPTDPIVLAFEKLAYKHIQALPDWKERDNQWPEKLTELSLQVVERHSYLKRKRLFIDFLNAELDRIEENTNTFLSPKKTQAKIKAIEDNLQRIAQAGDDAKLTDIANEMCLDKNITQSRLRLDKLSLFSSATKVNLQAFIRHHLSVRPKIS